MRREVQNPAISQFSHDGDGRFEFHIAERGRLVEWSPLDGTKQGESGNVLVEWTHEGESKSRLLKPGEYQEVGE